MTWTDDKCGKRVVGNDQHCAGCHETFANTSAGDAHRVDFKCVDPATMRRVDKDGNDLGALMELDKNAAWRIAPTSAQRASHDAFIERKKAEKAAMSEQSRIVNPEAVGDPDQTPIVQLPPNWVRAFNPCHCGGINGFHSGGCADRTDGCEATA